ncbi:MAG: hypothetical protein ACI8Y4_004905 [Candidatus Poriferisodalaceae bacterium]
MRSTEEGSASGYVDGDVVAIEGPVVGDALCFVERGWVAPGQIGDGVTAGEGEGVVNSSAV